MWQGSVQIDSEAPDGTWKVSARSEGPTEEDAKDGLDAIISLFSLSIKEFTGSPEVHDRVSLQGEPFFYGWASFTANVDSN